MKTFLRMIGFAMLATPPDDSSTSSFFRRPLLFGVTLLIGLGLIGFFGYWLLGQQEFAAGLAAYEAADCQMAMKHFNRVTGRYRWGPRLDVAAAETRLAECGLLIFAGNSQEQMNYADAVTGYETYLRLYPETVFGPQARNAVTEIYSQWAAQLRQKREYVGAIEKYQTLASNYPDTPPGQQATNLAAEVYGEWAAQLRAEVQYEAAIEKYQLIQREYPDTPPGQQATNLAAEVYGEWAAQLRTEVQYEAAIEKYQLIQREYPDTPSGRQAVTLAAEVYGEWAAQLREKRKYAEAIEKYQILLSDYPTSLLGRQAATLAAEIYEVWAIQLRQKGQYEAAVEKCQIILDKYPQTPTGQRAAILTADIYEAWAVQLQQEDQYEAAIKKYQLILDKYPDTSPGQQAATLATAVYGRWVNDLRERGDYEAALKTNEIFTNLFPDRDISPFLAESYTAWGQHLRDRQKYLEAMAKFDQAQQVTSDADVIAAAQQGYQDALWGLSQDTGLQGKQIIKESWDEACRGQPASSTAVGLVKQDEPGRAWFGGAEFRLPDHLQATNPGHLRAAVCLGAGIEEIEQCEYGFIGQYTVIRQRPWWRVTVRDVQTGDILHENKFNGSRPARCLFRESFSTWRRTKYKTGDPPSGEEVSNWLSTLAYPLVAAATAPPVVSPTLPASTPEATPSETSPVVAPPVAPIIPLESGVSIDQIGAREVIDVDLNLRNPREVYALVKGDGIYKSSNGGDGPWTRMNVDGSAMTAFVIDPTNPARFYAPTWNGVLKSSDGGNTWEVKANGLGIPNRPVDAITVHPSKPNVVYGGIGETLIVSVDEGENWSTEADGYGNGLGVFRFYQIVVDPFNPDIIYVGGAAGEIYKSIDAGRNFTRLSFNVGEGAFGLAAHPTQQDVYLAGINSYDAGIIKTENGTDFRSVSSGLIFGGADSAYAALTYAPGNPNIIYAGSGYEDDRVAKGIFKSADGGESWTSINNGLSINSNTGYPHYVKSIAAHPTNPDIVLAATGSGLYKSVDGGASWHLR